ncbi:DUF1810 domain-containing protein [Alkanindiges illinoisensis]|uniref:DUF1810 domain-containing protein n=1 Tax=Alkanindiges illinoisensis TaxID=197183 RepID=A0A4Y7XBZ9_9GAMM|nr:DUF1810 domain-containing protein [Alkanindiges illinoisensis]TEU25600.1 DUF1810 domain-containing protein [Alkanindiges illinoisensis]
MTDSLNRFVEAQDASYEMALREIQNGRKQSHWMWYIFPQLRGLGHSSTSVYFGIRDRAEAQDYLNHPVLGPRLQQITKAVLDSGQSVLSLFGSIDALKFSSCMTLFAAITDENSVFAEALSRITATDQKTLKMLHLTD